MGIYVYVYYTKYFILYFFFVKKNKNILGEKNLFIKEDRKGDLLFSCLNEEEN